MSKADFHRRLNAGLPYEYEGPAMPETFLQIARRRVAAATSQSAFERERMPHRARYCALRMVEQLRLAARLTDESEAGWFRDVDWRIEGYNPAHDDDQAALITAGFVQRKRDKSQPYAKRWLCRVTKFGREALKDIS